MPSRAMPEPNPDAPLAVYLLNRRHELKLTQRQIAKLIGVTSPAYHYWEKGMRVPAPHNIFFLAQACQTSMSTIKALLPSKNNNDNNDSRGEDGE